MRAIEFRQCTVNNGDFALRELNFHVDGGYITGLIGPNGAGKTTLIRSIMNMIGPRRGRYSYSVSLTGSMNATLSGGSDSCTTKIFITTISPSGK